VPVELRQGSWESLSIKAPKARQSRPFFWFPAELSGRALLNILAERGLGHAFSYTISKLALNPGSQISGREGCA